MKATITGLAFLGVRNAFAPVLSVVAAEVGVIGVAAATTDTGLAEWTLGDYGVLGLVVIVFGGLLHALIRVVERFAAKRNGREDADPVELLEQIRDGVQRFATQLQDPLEPTIDFGARYRRDHEQIVSRMDAISHGMAELGGRLDALRVTDCPMRRPELDELLDRLQRREDLER